MEQSLGGLVLLRLLPSPVCLGRGGAATSPSVADLGQLTKEQEVPQRSHHGCYCTSGPSEGLAASICPWGLHCKCLCNANLWLAGD